MTNVVRVDGANGSFSVKRLIKQTGFYDKWDETVLADKISDEKLANIFKEGFEWHENASSLAELKAVLKIVSPERLAKKYCMETFTGTGLHNIPKFFYPEVLSWWLGTQMANGIFYDFDAFAYDDVVKTMRDLGQKIYNMYAI